MAAGFARRDLRRRRRAGRLAARDGLAGGAAGADGDANGAISGPDELDSPERFTPQVYQQVMSGKPRMSGARAALEYFEVPDVETAVEAYADRKQSMVIELIEAGEFTAYPDALRFILAVKDAGIRVAAASSSKNAGLFLRQIRLDTLRRGAGPYLELPYGRAEPARILRRRRVRP